MESKINPTTPCFIRNNTPELREKLEQLGYTKAQTDQGGWTDESINKCRLLWTDMNGLYFHHYIESRPKSFFEEHIDCGESEDLFLALAALREGSDYGQWFVYDEDVPLIPRLNRYIPEGTFSCCMEDEFTPLVPGVSYHKATQAELINHFGS